MVGLRLVNSVVFIGIVVGILFDYLSLDCFDCVIVLFCLDLLYCLDVCLIIVVTGYCGFSCVGCC